MSNPELRLTEEQFEWLKKWIDAMIQARIYRGPSSNVRDDLDIHDSAMEEMARFVLVATP